MVDDLIDLEHAGLQVVSEREMRHHDRLRAAQPGREDLEPESYRVHLPRLDGWHYPDLAVLDAQGRRWAVEVELSAKARQRLRTIIGAWIAAPITQYAGVVYHTSPKALPGLRAAVTALQADDFVHIRPLGIGLRIPTSPSSLSGVADLTLS